ncbi:MAG: glycosyltransferase [Proteobacteria bacterium]|nr:glycosyltransferase [Pseudomonadota bacterium]MBU1611783.1 glycosyltransferase [Pseudomonadota bacterium]
MRILHLITGLETGGAETALQRLLAGMDSRYENRVVSLIPPGFVGRRISEMGTPVAHLGMHRGLPSPAALGRLVAMIRDFQPSLIQTWLYHADLLGLSAARLAGLVAGGKVRKIPVAWNLRCSYMDFSQYPRTTAWTVKVCAALSRFPAVVVANSEAAVTHHRGLGYRAKRYEVIANGFDTAHFKPQPGAVGRLREKLGIPEGHALAGMVARFDPMKDFPTLLTALARTPNLSLALCGQGLDSDNLTLARWLNQAGVADRVHLLGHRADVVDLLAGLDIYVSSSRGESFPNVVAEAMACGVLPVVTDVGASAEVVGETGRVVHPGDSGALADVLGALMLMPSGERRALGLAARARVEAKYSQKAFVTRYERLYDEFSTAG